MTQTGYLIVTIAVLAGLAVLALVCFLYLYKGRKKTAQKECAACSNNECPLAAKLNARKEDE